MTWWHAKHNAPIVARLAVPADRAQVSALLSETWRRHGGQALDDQGTVLQSGLSTIAFAGQEAIGFLGVTARPAIGYPPELWADVNVAAVSVGRSVSQILAPLLTQTLVALQAAGGTGLVCLTASGWLKSELMSAGFAEADQVVSYAHSDPHRLHQAPKVAQLHTASIRDVDTILALNAAAFTPFWRYADAAVMSWLLTADWAVVARLENEPVGFALVSRTTVGNFAHLSRVAIHPKAQGRGIGRQLVSNALRYAYESGAPGLALNTQASNTVSRRLYESLGFRLVDPVMSVLVYTV